MCRYANQKQWDIISMSAARVRPDPGTFKILNKDNVPHKNT